MARRCTRPCTDPRLELAEENGAEVLVAALHASAELGEVVVGVDDSTLGWLVGSVVEAATIEGYPTTAVLLL